MFQQAGGLRNLTRFLYTQRVTGFDVPDEPHLDEGATIELRRQLEAASFYLEFGTGGSTVLAAQRGIETISVDSDRFFSRAVRAKLAPGHKVTIFDIDMGMVGPWGWPVFDDPTPKNVEKWRRYIDVPMTEVVRRGRFPDFVLVDGRLRAACAIETARLAQAAGAQCTIMLDDYVERPHYRAIETYLGAPRYAGRAAIFEIGGKPKGLPIDRGISERFMLEMG